MDGLTGPQQSAEPPEVGAPRVLRSRVKHRIEREAQLRAAFVAARRQLHRDQRLAYVRAVLLRPGEDEPAVRRHLAVHALDAIVHAVVAEQREAIASALAHVELGFPAGEIALAEP